MATVFQSSAAAFRGRLRHLLLAAMLASGVIVSVPTPALAAGSYPITGVSVRYYPMYTADATVLSVIASQGCVPLLRYVATEIALGCAVAGVVFAAIPSNEFSGYWGDYVIQTRQVFVHEGALCNKSKSNCTLNKWDVYLKTGNFVQDTATWASLTSLWAPGYYGYSSVGYSPRAWWVSIGQLINILNGYGL